MMRENKLRGSEWRERQKTKLEVENGVIYSKRAAATSSAVSARFERSESVFFSGSELNAV